MTPSKSEVRTLLGGQVAILGQWLEVGGEDLNVVLVKLASPSAETAENQHTLPAPFAKEQVSGDILLFRNNEEAEPVDFTLADYTEFMRSKASEADASGVQEGGEEEEAEDSEEEEDEEESEEEEGEMTEEQVALLQTVIANFTEQRGRPPTEIELVGIMNKLNARMPEAGSDDSDCDEDELIAEAGGEDAEEEEEEEEEDEEEEDDDDDGGGGGGDKNDEHEAEVAEQDEQGEPKPARRVSARISKRTSISMTPSQAAKPGEVGRGAPAPPAPIVRKRQRAH
jgi:hypothetical protein